MVFGILNTCVLCVLQYLWYWWNKTNILSTIIPFHILYMKVTTTIKRQDLSTYEFYSNVSDLYRSVHYMLKCKIKKFKKRVILAQIHIVDRLLSLNLTNCFTDWLYGAWHISSHMYYTKYIWSRHGMGSTWPSHPRQEMTGDGKFTRNSQIHSNYFHIQLERWRTICLFHADEFFGFRTVALPPFFVTSLIGAHL